MYILILLCSCIFLLIWSVSRGGPIFIFGTKYGTLFQSHKLQFFVFVCFRLKKKYHFRFWWQTAIYLHFISSLSCMLVFSSIQCILYSDVFCLLIMGIIVVHILQYYLYYYAEIHVDDVER